MRRLQCSITKETLLSEDTGIDSLRSSIDRTGYPLAQEARASIAALARSLEVFDPPAARRAALRAGLADRIAQAAGATIQQRADAVCGALLGEISIIFTHVRPAGTVDVVPDPAAAVLAASVLSRLPDLAGVAHTIRHQYERWDGSGGPHGLRGPDIPLASRLLAISSTLVGHPQHGGSPNWTTRRRRVDELLGTTLDPDLGALIAEEFDSGAIPLMEADLDSALESLQQFVPAQHDSPVEALVSIGATVRAVSRMPDVLQVIGDQALRALEASTVTISRIGHDRSHSHVLLNVGKLSDSTETFPAQELHNSDDRPGFEVLLQGQGYLRSVDEGLSDDPTTASLHARGRRSEAAWPITIGQDVWGIVEATTEAGGRNLDHDDLATLHLVATHISAAVVQTERIAEFEQLAFKDPLTGLGNRRVLDIRLLEIFGRPAVDRQDVALIMCDVDGLKIVNDTLGHSAGDALLVDAASSLTTAAESVTDSTVCRIGGDEFCVVLDGGGMLSSQPVTDLATDLFGQSGEGRSMSCGIAVATAEVRSPGELLRRADVAQYEQKRIRKGLPPDARHSTDHDRRRTRRDP